MTTPDNFASSDHETLPSRRVVPEPGSGRPSPVDVTSRINPEPHAPTPIPPTAAANYNRGFTMPPPPPPPMRDSAARNRVRKRRVKGRAYGSEWAWVVIALALLSVVIVISMSVTLLLRASSDDENSNIPTAVAVLPTPVDGRVEQQANLSSGQQVTLDDGRSIVLQPWDGQSRFTMLLMGLDRRPGEKGLAFRSDVMMLISLDPKTRQIGILSIPRDLFVEVPGYGQRQRINTPMVLGELQQPGYGPKLAMQTVQYNFGIRVQDYIAVDFNAVIKMIDLVGGVDVDVPYNIADPQYPNMWYGYDPFYLSAGMHHLNGDIALKYARTRHQSSDFQRAQRQQQVLYAVRDQILNKDMLPNLVVQAPSLWSNFSENVYTGLTLDQIIQLAWYAKDIPKENIHNATVSEQYTMGWTTPDGAAVLIPNQAALGPLMVSTFGASYSE